MRILLMCEGTNEETLISALLDANAFKFTKDDLLSLSTSLDFDINLKDILTTDKFTKIIFNCSG